MKPFLGCVACTTTLLIAQPSLSADLYGTTVRGNEEGGSILHKIDPETGEVISTIGSVGYKVNGMAWDETTQTMYATTSTNDRNFGDGLITIDLNTGEGTPVGTGAGQKVNVPAVNSSGELFSWTERSDSLASWDKATGSLTDTGLRDLSTGGQSLAFDNNDVLYLLNFDEGRGAEGESDTHVYTIDTSTGASSEIGVITNLVLFNESDAASHHGDFNPDNNFLYAIGGIYPWDDGPRTIQIIDVLSLSMIGSFQVDLDSLHTLAFVDGELIIRRTMRPDRYTTAPDLIPSNVPTCNGSKFVNGFQILGGGEIKWFVEHSKKDECFDMNVTVLPEGVSAKVISDVLAALGSSNFDVYRLQ